MMISPEIRAALVTLACRCGIVWRDSRGAIQMCHRPADVVAIDNSVPFGICAAHVVERRRTKA